jgi:hypothetical protein
MSTSVGVVLFLIFAGCCNSVNQNRKKCEPWGFEPAKTTELQQLLHAVVFYYITSVLGVIHSIKKMPVFKDENGQKRSKTVLQYRKTNVIGLGYFYILAIK